MIRTVVCEKEGCSGSRFNIVTDNNEIVLTCDQCKSKYNYDVSYYDFIMLSNCSKCNNNTFKVFKDADKDGIYATCIECGSLPGRLYIDPDGTQVSYEGKILNDIKNTLHLVEQRICNLEVNVQDVERGQGMLEQSLAYINKYLIDRD
ncbi:hypothetical protein [Clostridium sp.]|uniref:hypothetical protein n=1 Tax=Clostridium sp. TaxID=1506 RepID=UPI002FC98E5F